MGFPGKYHLRMKEKMSLFFIKSIRMAQVYKIERSRAHFIFIQFLQMCLSAPYKKFHSPKWFGRVPDNTYSTQKRRQSVEFINHTQVFFHLLMPLHTVETNVNFDCEVRVCWGLYVYRAFYQINDSILWNMPVATCREKEYVKCRQQFSPFQW